MATQQQKKSLLDAYRTIGGFVSGRISLSQSSPYALTTPTGCSFKVYSDTLAIKVASPCFPSPIVAAVSYNEYTYLRTANLVVKMKYHHIVRQWKVNGGHQRCDLLRFQGILILNEGKKVILIDESSNEVQEQQHQFDIAGIVHPVTYVNKVLLYNHSNLLLTNVVSNKILFSYKKFLNNYQQGHQKITVVEASPLVDIIGVGFDSGVISFLHLRKDQPVFSVKQKLPVSAITFSSDESWMASGDEQGNVILWDLTSKRILYKFQECLKGRIDSLLFIPGLPVVTCGSSQANGIRQLRLNLEDNKILSLYRERLGSKQPLESGIIAGNNQLVLSTASDTMFVSFHSQCNNYLLPRTLHSKLPYHLIAKHFNVELYKGNSFEKSFPIHEHPVTAKISLSNKYYIVATKRKMIKLGGSTPVQWNIPNIHTIVLFNQHSIFAATPFHVVVCDFNTNIVLATIEVSAQTLTTNHSNTLLAFENTDEKEIQVWDMLKISQGRIFSTEAHGSVLCLSFTAQNRFLLSSHKGKLIIWSIVDNQLYKSFDMSGNDDLLWHSFTPDNQFMVSIFKGKKEANVWNNYIGRITSTRNEEILSFQPEIRLMQEDYRKELQESTIREQLEINEEGEDVMDSIPDAEDGVLNYSFKDITKWMPLVYYDQIRTRNAPNSTTDVPSMPFFLDFKNLTQEKKKIEQEIQREVREKRKNYSQQKDKHLKNKSNEITLNQSSTPQQHIETFEKLCSLSVAEVDYQLRSFLLNPLNKPYLVIMITTVLQESTVGPNQELKNIILSRIISLLGADLLAADVVEPCGQLLVALEPIISDVKQKVDRCVAISTKHLQ